MKKFFEIGSVVFLFILAPASIWAGSAPALEPSAIWEAKLAATDLVPGAEFGRSVAIEGDFVAVGAGGANAGSVDAAGAVYLFRNRDLAYVLEAKLIAPDATEGAEFGRAVAIQGDTVVVGARFAQVGSVLRAGAAYVFRKAGRSWRLEDKIASPTPADEDNFGRALAIHGDLLVVTARKEDINASDVGAAYVFRRVGKNWIDEAKLTPSDPAPGAYFGQSVAIRDDLIVVGARNADPNGAGAIYLFNCQGPEHWRPKGWAGRHECEWVQGAKLFPADGNSDEQFAFTVAIAGNLIAVGARRADLPGKNNAGAAYLFTLTGGGASQVAKLTASDAAANDQFGQSIAITGDIIAVGSNRADIGANPDQGAVYLFRGIEGSWTEVEKLTASGGKAADEIGFSLAAFGNIVVPGAHFANSTQGVVYLMPVEP